LTAIALAYFLCPIIEWYFQNIVIRPANVDADEDPLMTLDKRANDAATALERLTSTAWAADKTLTLRAVNDQLESAQRELTNAIARLQAAETRISSMETNLQRANSEIHGQQIQPVTILEGEVGVLDERCTTRGRPT
jgi:hypothetical protein